MKTPKTAYKVNQKIVYPSLGVGIIREIKERTFKEQMRKPRIPIWNPGFILSKNLPVRKYRRER